MRVARTLAALGLVTMTGCTDTARMFPINDAATAIGAPRFEFVRQGLGHGPVTVTLADGEVLKGEYRVVENTALVFGFSGAHTATAGSDLVSQQPRAIQSLFSV